MCVCFANYGDAYASSGLTGRAETARVRGLAAPSTAVTRRVPKRRLDGHQVPQDRNDDAGARRAHRCRTDGWCLLRSEIVWHKPNPSAGICHRPAHERARKAATC